MAWSQLSVDVYPTNKPGTYESRHNMLESVTGYNRAIILKWDHLPTLADKIVARDQIIDQLTNPAPQPTRTRDAKTAIRSILDSGITNAQKLTAISNYVDAMVLE